MNKLGQIKSRPRSSYIQTICIYFLACRLCLLLHAMIILQLQSSSLKRILPQILTTNYGLHLSISVSPSSFPVQQLWKFVVTTFDLLVIVEFFLRLLWCAVIVGICGLHLLWCTVIVGICGLHLLQCPAIVENKFCGILFCG
jgi:hypothetical protein